MTTVVADIGDVDAIRRFGAVDDESDVNPESGAFARAARAGVEAVAGSSLSCWRARNLKPPETPCNSI
jgi:hypothetical protein